VTGQLRPAALRLPRGQAPQIELPGGPPVVTRASRMQEPLHRSAWRATVEVVDRDVRRLLSRLGTRLVPLYANRLMTRRLAPSGV
jgi:hypothetical protein